MRSASAGAWSSVTGFGRARHDGDADAIGGAPGGGLVAHHLDRLGGGTDEREARVRDRAREVRALGQEPVAGVDHRRLRARGRLQDRADRQVGVGGERRADPVGLVGHLDVQRVAVGVAVDGDRGVAELSDRADDADRDLAAVRDQDPRFRHALRSVMLARSDRRPPEGPRNPVPTEQSGTPERESIVRAVRRRPGPSARTCRSACPRAVRGGYCLDPGDGPRAGGRRHARVDPRRRRAPDAGPRAPRAHVARRTGPGADVLGGAAARARPGLGGPAHAARGYRDGAGVLRARRPARRVQVAERPPDRRSQGRRDPGRVARRRRPVRARRDRRRREPRRRATRRPRGRGRRGRGRRAARGVPVRVRPRVRTRAPRVRRRRDRGVSGGLRDARHPCPSRDGGRSGRRGRGRGRRRTRRPGRPNADAGTRSCGSERSSTWSRMRPCRSPASS